MKTAIDTTIVVPTFNESGNVRELARRLALSCRDMPAEILFVDDSTDDTAEVISCVAAEVELPVRLIHRQEEERVGGLSGAVALGVLEARGIWVIVMDGDLQHPPEMVPILRRAADKVETDVVVASRYCGDGDASGLSGVWRRGVSSTSTVLTRMSFPRRVGRRCTDPMTGFFCIRRSAVRVAELKPRGFKILIEILARHDLRVSEVPFTFGERLDGESKASWRQGVLFVRQLVGLRLGRIWGFGLVGATGCVVNLAAMAVLLSWGAHYLVASILATEVAIVSNFLLQEQFVFSDVKYHGKGLGRRAWQSMSFNNAENILRLPFLIVLVELTALTELAAQALTIACAFVARFLFVTRVVYRPNAANAVARAGEVEAA
jgi:dolichol-phosphate mannosyltransferase